MSTATLYWLIRGFTVAFLFVIRFTEMGGSNSDSILLAGILILTGVPHGAADHLIFRSSRGPLGGSRHFMLYYGSLVILYSLLWYFLPLLALLLFLLVSVFHFGQSYGETQDLKPARFPKWTKTLAWGVFVLGFPVIWHFGEAGPIVERMTGFELVLGDDLRYLIALVLVVVNLIIQERNRLMDLGLLLLVFIATDLLLGFGLYFLVWHSIPAGVEQWRYLARNGVITSFADYLWKLIPLSVVAFVGLGIGYWWLQRYAGGGVDIGLVFILISLITLPHALLVDRVYR